jgi:hypothetical protein
MKKIYITALLSLCLCTCLPAQDFGKAIKEEADSLWTQTPETFRKTFGPSEIYKWKSPLKRVLTYNSGDSKTELSFFEHPVDKGTFSFKSNKLQAMRLTFKKPEAISSKETYLEYLSKLAKQIEGLAKIGTPRLRKRKSGDDYSFTYSWRSPEYYISLRCRCSIDAKAKFNPGKSRFSIFRRIPVVAAGEKFEASSEEPPQIDENSKLKTNDKGDYYLEVPMRKEGSHKECLYYSVKRIFDYYKTAPKDRNWKKIKAGLELNVKGAKGLKRVFSSVIGECRCDVSKIASTRIFDDFNRVMGFIRDYNKNAGEMEKKRINSFKATSFEKLLTLMDEDVLVKTRDNSEKIAKFKSGVCKEINEEKPVLWVVFLGVVKEKVKPLVSSGGYVRIIVGYNPKTNEVIYSDNWGKGHELKKMSWEKAWAITLTALAVTVKK